MNILLANPKSSSAFDAFGFLFPPIGLLYVAAAAEKEGYKITIEDFCISQNRPLTFDFRAYDVVGITTNTRRFSSALKTAKIAKKSGCTVIMGGPHPAFVDEEILQSGYVDFIVKGEGEMTFPALLNVLKNGDDPSAIKGISYIKNGNIFKTPQAELIRDLDALPFPARHLVDIEAYKKNGLRYGGKRPMAMISSSRGCPHNCSFCLTPQMYGQQWRARSAVSVMAEIEQLYYQYGYRAIAFSDDNFTVSPQRVKDLCSMIIERGLDIWWWCLSSPKTLLRNEDMVRLMAKAGAKTVYIGVESANPETLKEFNKETTHNAPFETVNLLKRHGIETFASYILGGLSDDAKNIRRTIKLARKLDTAVAQFTILTPYPGTHLYNEIKDILRHRKWHLYDALHLVFKHRKVSFVTMEMLLLWAYISYYVRSWHAFKGFLRSFLKNTPFLRKFFGDTD